MEDTRNTTPRTVWDPRKGWRDETRAEVAARIKADDDLRFAQQQERIAKKARVNAAATIHAAALRANGGA